MFSSPAEHPLGQMLPSRAEQASKPTKAGLQEALHSQPVDLFCGIEQIM
jgi:hypothetical protein